MRQYEWLLGNCKQCLEQIRASDDLQRVAWVADPWDRQRQDLVLPLRS